MKKIIVALCVSFVLFSCTDKKKQETDMLNEVIKVHDRVMEKENLIMINKMQLDTLIKANISAHVTDSAKLHITELDSADSRMENWMHGFDAENKGKSHDEIMTYLTAEKKKIDAIDSNFNIVVANASKFIKQNKTK
ncbi:hypothetical protein GWR56_17235 [Mucilaginibacter sp. 14171R-50]|uniref:hypothetical protein n=1 Tax=Mucilaginibacter sp. 14171R-50 TaxID=2703789 RepID=UPI00138D8736|nr:hypothetical protein [Mucilaginibacter sp. 14171R-50]QHS57197.1 hypothetical protein GWR56_17235 [Mucilaginibacter sp. 14171R-50]